MSKDIKKILNLEKQCVFRKVLNTLGDVVPLIFGDFKTLTHALVTSRLDYGKYADGTFSETTKFYSQAIVQDP